MLKNSFSCFFKQRSNSYIATSIFICCKTTASTISNLRPTPFTDFIQDVDEKQFLVKFSNVPELQNAPEKIKKLFTLEYGNAQDRKEKKIKDLIEEIDEEKQCPVLVSAIVEMTVTIKETQENYLNNRKKNKHLIEEIFNLAQTRVKFMDKLRDHHFEIYAKALPMLNIEHYFEPEYQIKSTTLADEVSDMRIRAFAESRRITAIADKRKNKLLKLKKEFQQDLSNSDQV